MVLPYLKGLVIIKCCFFYILYGSIVYLVFVVIILVDIFRFLTIGIRALSLGRNCGQIFFFWRIFFLKKQGRDIIEVFSTFLCKICIKGLYI
jgi:hypothetical protein